MNNEVSYNKLLMDTYYFGENGAVQLLSRGGVRVVSGAPARILS